MKDGPRAIFANHDTLAAGVVLEARSTDLRLREDMAVVGFETAASWKRSG